MLASVHCLCPSRQRMQKLLLLCGEVLPSSPWLFLFRITLSKRGCVCLFDRNKEPVKSLRVCMDALPLSNVCSLFEKRSSKQFRLTQAFLSVSKTYNATWPVVARTCRHRQPLVPDGLLLGSGSNVPLLDPCRISFPKYRQI